MRTLVGALASGLIIVILEVCGVDVSLTLAILIGLLMGCFVVLIGDGS